MRGKELTRGLQDWQIELGRDARVQRGEQLASFRAAA
jgi:hypothetical protein